MSRKVTCHHCMKKRQNRRKCCCCDSSLFITDISPNVGPKSGNILVRILGRGFGDVQHANFGETTAHNFKVINVNEIIVMIPKIGTQNSDVCVTVSTGKYISNAVFFKVVDPPIITSINPSSGSIGLLANITIYGNNFSTLKYVSFGESKVDVVSGMVSVLSDTVLNFAAILHPNCLYSIPISVTTIGGTSNTVYYGGVPPPII
jgi:hypothetical protein